jgi:hypothetical protein
MPRPTLRAYMCTSTARATMAAHTGAVPSQGQYRLRLLSGACLAAPRAAARPGSRPGAPAARPTAQHRPSWPGGPRWYTPATPAVLAVIHACEERLRGAGAARDAGRSAPNGRPARNPFRGAPPTRAWAQHAGPAPLRRVQGSRCTAFRRRDESSAAQLASARCCNSFNAPRVIGHHKPCERPAAKTPRQCWAPNGSSQQGTK